MEAHWYPMREKWVEKFLPHLSNQEFLDALYVYRGWWLTDPVELRDQPLCQSAFTSEFRSSPKYLCSRKSGDYSEDEKEHLANLYPKGVSGKTSLDPEWYVVPHDCINLNNIVTWTLCRLVFPEVEHFYSLTMVTPASHEHHTVITNKAVPVGTVLHFSYDQGCFPGMYLFDLYYPFMSSYFGYDYMDRSLPLSEATVFSCTRGDLNWSPTHYNYDCAKPVDRK